jgi:hypothetical protein
MSIASFELEFNIHFLQYGFFFFLFLFFCDIFWLMSVDLKYVFTVFSMPERVLSLETDLHNITSSIVHIRVLPRQVPRQPIAFTHPVVGKL